MIASGRGGMEVLLRAHDLWGKLIDRQAHPALLPTPKWPKSSPKQHVFVYPSSSAIFCLFSDLSFGKAYHYVHTEAQPRFSGTIGIQMDVWL
jgi:hypothetical protein